jgi:hypothetical protein
MTDEIAVERPELTMRRTRVASELGSQPYDSFRAA